jgi:hypothetical protein
MLFPIVGYQFDVRNCDTCEYFKPLRTNGPQQRPAPR